MRKRKVLSVFGVLLAMAIGLSFFNFSQFGGLTGRAIDASYNQELFSGDQYEFNFNSGNFEIRENSLLVQGRLLEFKGRDHNLQITGYVFDSFGDHIGTTSKEVFLAESQELDVTFSIPIQNDRVGRVLLYIEDESTSVKVEKEFPVTNSFITASAVKSQPEIQGGAKLIGFVLSAFLLLGAVLFVVSRLKQHARQSQFENVISQKHSRKYIDLDLR